MNEVKQINKIDETTIEIDGIIYEQKKIPKELWQPKDGRWFFFFPNIMRWYEHLALITMTLIAIGLFLMVLDQQKVLNEVYKRYDFEIKRDFFYKTNE